MESKGTRKNQISNSYAGFQDKEERTVQVSSLDGPITDTGRLVLYLQNRRKSGGGPIEDVIPQGGSYLVTFEKKQDAANVMTRKHDLGDIELSVSSYDSQYEKLQSSTSPTSLSRVSPPSRTVKTTNPKTAHNLMDSHGYVLPVKTHEFQITDGKHQYLKKFLADDVEKIAEKYFVNVKLSEDSIVLRGSDNALESVIHEINSLLRRISDDTYSISMPRVLDFLRSTIGRQQLDTIGDFLKCTVDVDEGLYASIDKNWDCTDTRIQLIHGGMASQQADVLVTTVGRQLDLSAGSISSSLLGVGGEVLQRQCFANYPDGLQHGDVAKTTGGELNCQEVYYCCLPEWRTQGNMQDLQAVLYNCLFEATQSGYRSIVFPAFGTGFLQYPTHQVAKLMFTEIEKFLTCPTSLERVAIVLYPLDLEVIEAFEAESQTASQKSPSYPDDVQMRHEPPQQIQVKKDVIKIGNMTVQIKQGDITQEDTDCIVNSTDPDLTLNRGVLSSAISNACGQELQLQCNLKVAEMHKKGIIVTGAPRLPCNSIIHVAFDHFHGSWKEIIKTCLKTAHERSMSSIAFPPLGTGAGSLAMERMTKILISTLREFSLKNSTVKDIRVVIFEETKHRDFLSKLEEIIQKNEKENRLSKLWNRKSRITKVIDSREVVMENRPMPEIPPPSPEPLKDEDDGIVMCRVSSSGDEAEIRIFSEIPENRTLAFQQIQDLCHQHIIKKSFVNQKLQGFTNEQLFRLKGILKEMNINMVVHPDTGVVDVEGLRDDVVEIKSLLNNMVDNLAPH